MKRKKLLILSLTLGLGILGSLSYAFFHQKSGFSMTAPSTNRYSAGIKESAYDALPDSDGNGIKDQMENLTPRKTITLDPAIVSDVPDTTWALIKISVPTVTSKLKPNDGATVHDIFTFAANPEFILLKKDVSDTAGTPSVYYYGLKNLLPKNGESTPIFTEVTVNNFLENDAITDTTISIEGVVMQSEAVASVADAFRETGDF